MDQNTTLLIASPLKQNHFLRSGTLLWNKDFVLTVWRQSTQVNSALHQIVVWNVASDITPFFISMILGMQSIKTHWKQQNWILSRFQHLVLQTPLTQETLQVMVASPLLPMYLPRKPLLQMPFSWWQQKWSLVDPMVIKWLHERYWTQHPLPPLSPKESSNA